MLRIGSLGYSNGIDDALGDTPTTQSQFDAMVSLAYNVGIERTVISSVVKYHRKGQYRLASRAFMRWTKAGGRVYRGLVRRRIAEQKLYLSEVILDEERTIVKRHSRRHHVCFRGRLNRHKGYKHSRKRH